MAWIYKITSPKKRVYIGSTVNIKARWKNYRALNCKEQIKLYNSFRKYGVKNHVFEIITECRAEEMFRLEATYGHLYNSLGRNGLNCALPKNGQYYQVRSQETKLRISLSRKGNTNRKGTSTSAEGKLNMSIARKGKPSGRKGIPFTDEHRKAISEGSKGKKHSIETRQKMSAIQLANKYNKGGYKLGEGFGKRVSERLLGNRYCHGYKHNAETCKKRSIASKTEKNKQLLLSYANSLTFSHNDGIYYNSAKEAYFTYPSIFKRWKLKYFHNMLGGYKRNRTNFSYA